MRLFTPQRWAAAAPGFGTRADLAHHLAAWLARAGGEAPRPLPRLDGDLVLPDQLAVTAHDLVRVAPPALAAGAVAHLLLHRLDLLGEQVPTGLATELGLSTPADVLDLGRRTCRS